MSSLKVSAIKCSDLPNIEGKDKDSAKKTDPYVIVEYLGSKKETEKKDDCLDPEYGEVLDFDLSGKELGFGDKFIVTIKDYERIGRNRLVGSVEVPLQPLLSTAEKEFTGLVLRDGQGRATSGKVQFTVAYQAPEGAAGGAAGGGAAGDAGGEAAPEGEEAEEEVEELVDASGNPVPEGTPGAVMVKRKKKVQRKRRVCNLADKPTDFQVRLKIIEGRQLPGANINPTIRVKLGGELKQTRVKRSTNRPYFDETFFYNFNLRPNELFDQLMEFEVFNSKGMLSDSLLGSFQCDVGTIWDESEHLLLRKWLLLSASEDDTKADEAGEGEEVKSNTSPSPAGYLQITAMILGPGDEIPNRAKGAAKGNDDAEDIESNLLRPAGVSLRPATFLVKIYRAEDVPQMDTALLQNIKKLFSDGPPKELVDPYVTFEYAGKKASTKIMFANDHPEFNQELRVSFKFPSMCERLKVQMFDYDKIGNDDVVGTAHIALSSISGDTGDGFLPAIGPCFINFYGSLREFSNLPDEFDDLNKGRGEGVAYRGRALVEIDTKFGDHAKDPCHDIMPPDMLRVQTYLRRRKYKLFASFMSANMICESDGPIEFEVSIGNYGNKLDSSCEPQSSTTPPYNAVYDGNSYYYLPWNETKPCCQVESHWEDIAFRLEPLNILLKIIDKLEKNIRTVEISKLAKAPPPEIAANLIGMLDQLISDLKTPIPTFEGSLNGVNELDLKMQEIRLDEMKALDEEVTTLRSAATDVDEAMDSIEGFLTRLRDLVVEPQNSVPDVIIWMISGSTRIAYCRIPAYDIMFSENPLAKGKDCSKLQNLVLKYPGKKAVDFDKHPEVPAQVQVIVWFGLEKDQKAWTETTDLGGEVSVFAETYENNIFNPITRNWTTKLMKRPAYSDSQGDIRLMKENFVPPPGWQWDNPPDGDWFVDPELSSTHDADAGHTQFMEDCFENENRNSPIGNFGTDSETPYTDVRGDSIDHRDEIQCPEGWKWQTDWAVDINRACDEDGWEYCIEKSMGGWGAVMKTYHLCRRRRWVRSRKMDVDPKKIEKKKKEEAKMGEGWEHAVIFGEKFHLKERKKDLVRRRRWHRKMVNVTPGATAIFQVPDEDDDKLPNNIMPRMFLSFDEPHKWQLRAYIFQARDCLGLDSEGTSDPYAKVCFQDQSQNTEVKNETLCPDWDQTLIFEEINMFENTSLTNESPPRVVVELYDKDKVGKDEFLGRAVCTPMVKLNGQKPPAAQLAWYPIMRGPREAGELLAAFELFLDEGSDLPLTPPLKDNLYTVPSGIRPVLVRTGVEVCAWGVRQMKKYQLASCTSPKVVFEIGGNMKNTDVIKNTKRNPNFKDNFHFFDVLLPKKELYMPPMNIRVHDHRTFGRKPVVGRHVLKEMEKCEPKVKGYESPPTPKVEPETKAVAAPSDVAVDLGGEPAADKNADKKSLKDGEKVEELEPEKNLDWWSKYYASTGELDKCGDYMNDGYKTIECFPDELENVCEYKGFGDFVKTFNLTRGFDDDEEDQDVVGEFKGLFKFYPLPADPNVELPPKYFCHLPSSLPQDVIIRVYIVRAIDLQPKDPNGKADPFLEVHCGKKKISDKDNYLPNTIQPVFGRMFEMQAKIPLVKDLKIKVMDYDMMSSNDLIGETTIDLENRLYSSYRPLVGLAPQYFTSGINKWRDSQTPCQILEAHCKQQHLPPPRYLSDTQVIIDKDLLKLDDFEPAPQPGEPAVEPNARLGPEKERLALHILNTRSLVKEHIETRSLYNPLQPGADQGQLQMWVDMFPTPAKLKPAAPINICPRKADPFTLRVIVWNTADVTLMETSITGEMMSDIYLKGWMGGLENNKQKTDVHYRSLNGEGMFNWRFVFPFDYMTNEKVMVVSKKEHFWSLDKTTSTLPPTLTMQVWDADLFNSDDFIGTVEFSLDAIPSPAKKPKSCKLSDLDPPDNNNSSGPLGSLVKREAPVNLFDKKELKGWWPMYLETPEGRELSGKVELTLEIVTDVEEAERPAGVARDEPNSNPLLDPPDRPDSSFGFFMSPWKMFKFIIWRNYKWHIIIGFIILLLILAVALFLYNVPGTLVKKIMI